MVPFIGTGAANAATTWFFGLRTIEAQASASGASTALSLIHICLTIIKG